MCIRVLLIACLVAVVPSGLCPAEERANVLFVAVDDLNDWVGCLGGNPQTKTPNLDKFARSRAMVMSKAYCPAAVCGPSRTALLTGLLPSTTGVYGNYPTLVELCGLPANDANEGRSFAPLLRDPTIEWNHPTLTTQGFQNHSLTDGRYRYIRHGGRGEGAEELYDHADDPKEWNNLANQPGYEAIKERLRGFLPEHDEPDSSANRAVGPEKAATPRQKKASKGNKENIRAVAPQVR